MLTPNDRPTPVEHADPEPAKTLKTAQGSPGPMHRHGTMKGRWKALAFGALWVLLGWLTARPGLNGVFADEVPRPPGGWEALSIFGGGALVIIGLVLGLTPHIIWALRSFYKEDFAPDARCPVMLVCPACNEYNHRARIRCSACTGPLIGARAAGGDPPAVAKKQSTGSEGAPRS